MTKFLTLTQVLELHVHIQSRTGGAIGVRDLAGLKSALSQPQMTFGGDDLYPTLIDKASALGFSLVMNHPFVDGNKRIGHAVMEAFLLLNDLVINASVDEQEETFLKLAAGELTREAFTDWIQRITQSEIE